MCIRVIHPGVLTMIQDTGRQGYQHQGVSVSGAMDVFALRVANLLVGNDEGAAALEVTLRGPELLMLEGTLIAICGGHLSPTVDGKPIPLWRSVYINAGSTLKFGKCVLGARGYVAVAGGFDVPKVMGSSSTYMRAGIGGHEGRALKADDQLACGKLSELAELLVEQLAAKVTDLAFAHTDWFIGHNRLPAYGEQPVVRVIRGREYEYVTDESLQQFYTSQFQVAPQSDRMGYRLKGPVLQFREKEPHHLISGAVNFGAIQVPNDGNPIILMADCQTTGGYHRIAQVITVDLPVLAQVKPGDFIRFSEISLHEAQYLYIKREQEISIIAKAISLLIQERG